MIKHVFKKFFTGIKGAGRRVGAGLLDEFGLIYITGGAVVLNFMAEKPDPTPDLVVERGIQIPAAPGCIGLREGGPGEAEHFRIKGGGFSIGGQDESFLLLRPVRLFVPCCGKNRKRR